MNTKDRYTDIFDEPLDASFEQPIEQIAALYSANEPPAQLSWTRLQFQMRKKEPVSSKQHRMALNWMRPKPRAPRRLALVTALLVFLLLLSGFAYATFNLGVLGNLLNNEPGSQYLLQTKQFTLLQQSQVVDGYNVTLDRAYADANRVIVGVIVTYPHGIDPKTWDTSFVSYDHLDGIVLKTSTGQALPWLVDKNGLDVSNPRAGKEGLALVFDGAVIQGNPAQLPLNLRLGVECNANAPVVCKHTLTYNFTLPFHAGRVMNLHQTVTANGHALILERVVVTPSETRLYIHWQPGDLQPPAFALPGGHGGPATYTQSIYHLQLSASGQTYHICDFNGDFSCIAELFWDSYPYVSPSFIDKGQAYSGPELLFGNPQIVGVSLFQPLYNQHGTWTLIITQSSLSMQIDAQGNYISTSPPFQDASAKPWVFTFNAK